MDSKDKNEIEVAKTRAISFWYGLNEINMVYEDRDYIGEKINKTRSFYEKQFLETIYEIVPVDGMIIDVGANIGNHTIFFSSVMGQSVLAIEPIERNFKLLKDNVRNNCIENVLLINVALSDKEGLLKFKQMHTNNCGSFSAQINTDEFISDETIDMSKAVTLDKLIYEADIKDKINLIKIDVEGMELAVLGGAIDTIKNNLPIIACECSTHTEYLQVASFLDKFNYRVLSAHNDTPTFIFINRANKIQNYYIEQYQETQAYLKAYKKPNY